MWHSPPELRKASREHKCTYCAELIERRTRYWRWMTRDEDFGAATNKMHEECYADALANGEYGQFEYTLYGHERPHAAFDPQPHDSGQGALRAD